MSEEEIPTIRFNEATLQDFSDGDLDFEKELIDTFKSSVEECISKLKVALDENNSKDAYLQSHSIKGMTSYLGAEVVHYLSTKINGLCNDKDLAEAAASLGELEGEVDAVLKILATHPKYGSGEEEDKKEGEKEEVETKEDKKEEEKKAEEEKTSTK